MMKKIRTVLCLFVVNVSLVQAADLAIKGVIKAGSKVKVPESSTAVLFVFARPLGVTEGPPSAVEKIVSPKFPQSFSISSANAMMPGTPFKGKFQIFAKLSNSGAATTSTGDLLGRGPKEGASPGDSNVVVVLEKVAP
jgi:hypothetical protein